MDELREEMDALIKRAASAPQHFTFGLGWAKYERLLELVEQVIGTGEAGHRWRMLNPHPSELSEDQSTHCRHDLSVNPACEIAKELVQKAARSDANA